MAFNEGKNKYKILMIRVISYAHWEIVKIDGTLVSKFRNNIERRISTSLCSYYEKSRPSNAQHGSIRVLSEGNIVLHFIIILAKCLLDYAQSAAGKYS